MPPRKRPEVTPLEQMRLARGESLPQAVEGIRRLAHERGHPLDSLNPAQLCRWEDGYRPSWDNADTLCAYYETSVVAMGWAADHTPPDRPAIGRVPCPPEGASEPTGHPGGAYSGTGQHSVQRPPARLPGPGTCIALDRPPRGRAGAQIMDGLDDTLGFIARAERVSADPEIMNLLQEQLRSLAGAYEAPSARFTGPLLNVQRAAFRLLDGPTEPEQSRDLFFLAAIACGLLANVGLDASQPATAHVYARAALLCADRASHPGLRTWVRIQQGRIAYWNSAPGEALRYFAAAESDAAAVVGTMPASLAAQQARAHAALGDAATARAALERAADARDRVNPDDLDEIGGASLTLPLSVQLMLRADTLSYLPGAAGTENAAVEAIAALDTPDHGGSDYGNLVLARVDLALARVGQRDVDGAGDALRPILELPTAQIYHGVRTQVQRVRAPLADPGFHGSPAARDLAVHLEHVALTPTTARLPE